MLICVHSQYKSISRRCLNKLITTEQCFDLKRITDLPVFLLLPLFLCVDLTVVFESF